MQPQFAKWMGVALGIGTLIQFGFVFFGGLDTSRAAFLAGGGTVSGILAGLFSLYGMKKR